jgi:hypothetical protein
MEVEYFWGRQNSMANAFFGKNVNKSVHFFLYGFRLTFAVFMEGDLLNSFSAV